MLTSDKAKIAAIARDLETVLQEMAAMREETRALTATLTRVAEKVEAILAQSQIESAGSESLRAGAAD
jgi:hypothetical protein